jgi:hypothetical protein
VAFYSSWFNFDIVLQRLAVDPNSNGILYFGAGAGKGLWKSTNFGVTWQVYSVMEFNQSSLTAVFPGLR